MNFRQLNNEKGITLVELLAAIGLLAIVIALSSTIFTQMFSAEEKSEGDIRTKQTLNVIAAEMKHDFFKGEERICARDPLKGITISFDSEDILDVDEEGCIIIKEGQNTLPIVITATSDQGGSTEIKTSWKKKTVSLDIPIEQKPEEEPSNPDPEEEPSEPDPEEETEPEPDEEPGDTLSCKVEGSLMLTKKVKLMKGICPNDTYEITGALHATESLSLQHDGVTLIVRGSAQFDGKVDLAKNSLLDIGGAGTFNHDLKLKKDSRLKTGGPIVIRDEKRLALHKGATITINGWQHYLP
ncbi:PulJ/GspJ family protein [Oceanobacillus manasiensis]|uniref:PulJ/GspJ family protein n=1 Tax=Oceanobacillus manasiensis TaxID=586413 RepID=UPI0005A7A967|nr:prepilin-type N-terminal cleavage/methylation domain-containing protein [Oceanobacillus manasiensis]